MNIARYFDSAVLKPDMTPEQVEAAIKESIAFDSYSVCVRGCDIDLAMKLTEGTNTCVSCVLDFPYGYSGIEVKRAAARDLESRNPDPRYAAFEDELLELINRTGIGPQGLGGETTALKVHVEWAPTHIASLPVAVNINCHAARHAEVRL